MKNFLRPIVLPSITSLICAFAVLSFPQHFPEILAAVFVVVLTVSLLLFAKRQRVLALLFAFTVLFTVFNSIRLYTSRQVYAESFIRSVGQSENCVFTAKVSDCRNFGSYSTVYADIFSANGKELRKKIPARLGCYSAGELLEGDVITFSGKPRKLSDIPKDGFDTEKYLKSKYIFCDFESASIISSSAAEGASFIPGFRRYIKDVFFTYIRDGYDTTQSSICYAMFAGDKDYLSDTVRQSFSRSGLTHLLCVSGLHLTILAGFAFSLLSLLTLHKRLKCILIICLCIFYTCLTGFSMSTVRSCIICILTFTAMFAGRKTDGYVSLFFAMAAMCALSPYSVYDISAQLSYLSAFGIICFSDLLPVIYGKGRFTKAACLIFDGIKSNFGAVIFSLPAVSFYFGEFSTVSVISTFCVSFICQLLLISLVFLVTFSFLGVLPLGETVLYFIGSVCRTLCLFISKAADFFASFRFSAISAEGLTLYPVIFVILLIFLSVSIGFGLRRTKGLLILSVVLLAAVFCFSSLITAIIKDGQYSVSYYRKSSQDRQMSIKLCGEGYLVINADNKLCLNSDKAEFDAFGGRNYLLIIPDNGISPHILADSIRAFKNEFGLKGIFTTDTDDGILLAKALSEHDIVCKPLPGELDFTGLYIEYTDSEYFSLSADDGNIKTTVIFADKYDKEYFGKDSDICAYFTRYTKNQFSPSKDVPPDCDVFFTRLGKDEYAEKTVNTYGLSRFYIKE